MVRKVTVERFEQWKLVAENVEAFFALMEMSPDRKPLRFRDACMAARVPYTLMHAYVKGTPELKARYDAIRAANADLAAHKAETVADGLKGAKSMVKVGAARVQIDAYMKLASKWDKEDYGETVRVEKEVRVSVDAGPATELLRAAKQRALGDTVTIENSAPPVKLVESDAG